MNRFINYHQLKRDDWMLGIVVESECEWESQRNNQKVCTLKIRRADKEAKRWEFCNFVSFCRKESQENTAWSFLHNGNAKECGKKAGTMAVIPFLDITIPFPHFCLLSHLPPFISPTRKIVPTIWKFLYLPKPYR